MEFNNNNHGENDKIMGEEEYVQLPIPVLTTSSSIELSEGKVLKQELCRLLADGLRDLGYSQSAATLEQESGFHASSSLAKQFLTVFKNKQYESCFQILEHLPFKHGNLGKKRCKNLIVQERYVDLLMSDQIDEAIQRLQEEIYFLHFEDETDLSELASLLACPTKNDLLTLSGRLRTKQMKRFTNDNKSFNKTATTTAIECVRALLDSDAVVPPNRLLELLGQSLARQLMSDSVGQQQEMKRFDQQEPLPLLRQIREVEERRNAKFTPNADCFQVIQINSNEIRGVEIWCCTFHPNGTSFAIGTRDGSVYIYDFDDAEGKVVERKKFDHVCGHDRPIVSLDWNSVNGDMILCVSRKQVKTTRSSIAGSSVGGGSGAAHASGGDDDDDMEDQQDEADSTSLVQAISLNSPNNNKSFSPVQLIAHGGKPLAKWIIGSQVVTSGPDGWLKFWKLTNENKSSFTCTKALKVERVVDMAVTRAGELLFLACADMKIRCYSAATEQLVCQAISSEPIVSINVGFSSLIASVKNQTLLVWNLNTLTDNGRHTSSSVPLLSFKGFSRKRYILKPCIGEGDFVATGSEDGNIYIWSSRMGGSASSQPIIVLKGHTAAVNEVSFSPTQPGVLVSGSDDGSIRIWSKRNASGRYDSM